MPYLANWEEYSKQAQELYDKNPMECRVVFKYRHNDGRLVVKVTDNRVCLKYLAEQAQDVKKIDKLLSGMMRNMVCK